MLSGTFHWPQPHRICPSHPCRCLLLMPLFTRTRQKSPWPNISTDVAAALSCPHRNEPYEMATLSLGQALILSPSTKHWPKSIAFAKGHLDQEQKNLQIAKPLQKSDDDNVFPSPDSPNEKNYTARATIKPFVVKHKAYHDLTGQFPHRSSRGNECILIVYDYDSNSILHCALK
jgi:hypothetical protein